MLLRNSRGLFSVVAVLAYVTAFAFTSLGYSNCLTNNHMAKMQASVDAAGTSCPHFGTVDNYMASDCDWLSDTCLEAAPGKAQIAQTVNFAPAPSEAMLPSVFVSNLGISRFSMVSAVSFFAQFPPPPVLGSLRALNILLRN